MKTGIKTDQLTREKLKQIHQKQIFLCAKDGISRAELTARLKLSFPSISALVDEMLEHSVLVETGSIESGERGRPRTLLCVNPDIITVPVFELKNNGYRFVLYNARGTRVEEHFLTFGARRPAGTDVWRPSLDELCTPVIDCVKALSGNYHLSDIILSIPGNVNESDVFTSSLASIVSPPGFLRKIEAAIGRKVITVNRADCFAYSELLFPHVPEDFLYLYISSGLGAGIIRNGKILRYGSWRAGEIGHMSIDYMGRACPCGSRGCLERYLSTDAITQDGCLLLSDIGDFSDLCKAYRDGVPEIEGLLAEKAELLCAAINNMFALLPIRSIIIGGSITELGDKFLACLACKMKLRTSRMYKGKPVLTFSQNHSDDSTVGAFHNYVNNVMEFDMIFHEHKNLTT